MGRLLKGLGALVIMGAILIGTPIALLHFAGNPIPSLDQLQSIISLRPDYGNELLFTKIIPLMGWIAWLFFAIPLLLEIVVAIAGLRISNKISAPRGLRKPAAALVTAVAMMFGGIAIAAPASAAPVDGGVVASVAFEAPLVERPVVAPVVAPAPVSEVVEAPASTYVVQEGDTLFGIAESQLGEGDRYPEIFAASQDVQSDGGQLTDPDLIYPGWTVEIPGGEVAPAPAPAAVVEVPASEGVEVSSTVVEPAPVADSAPVVQAPVEESAPEVEAPVEAPVVSSTSAAEVPAADAGASVDEIDEAFPLSTVGGVGGLLAVGLLSALGGRRLWQRRKRSRGAVVPMPQGAAADLELEMRVVENPIVVADVDNALRSLQIWAEDTGAALPELLAVRVADDEASFYLSSPGDMPAPFELIHPDRTAWVVRPGQAGAPAREASSPYPALITIGTDAAGGVLLLDLEQLGSINIVGNDSVGRGMLNAIAAELSVNPWTDQTQVTLVGLPVGLVQDLGRFQVQHVDDVEALLRNLQAEVADRKAALDSFDVDDVKQARVEATELETWAPHIVLLGVMPEPEHRAQLEELVVRLPRLGIATIANGAAIDGGATIRVADRDAAEYVSGGALPALPFKPQILDGEELELLQSIFETAAEEPVIPEAIVKFEAGHDAEAELESSEVEQDDADTLIDETVDDEAAITVVDVEARDEESIVAVQVTEPDPELAAVESAPVEVPGWPAPYLRLMGPLEALNLPDKADLPGRTLELLSFLHLQGEPVPGALLQKHLWPDKYDPTNNNAKVLARQVRVALGTDPDGEQLLPTGRKGVGFRVHPMINSDWADFQRLIGSNLETTPTNDLITAIRLVRGEPFDGADARRGWWVWRTPFEAEMRAAILDAADELTTRALAAGDVDNARLAGRMAQASDPLNEAGWRMEIRAAMASGDKNAFNEIIDQMYARVIGATDVELDESTQELISTGTAQLHESS